jgi:hypothetical protein
VPMRATLVPVDKMLVRDELVLVSNKATLEP